MTRTLVEALALVQAAIQDGSALATLRRFVALNGGDAKALDDFSRLPQPGQVVEIRSARDGFLSSLDGRALGILAMELGAGRKDRNGVLDLGVGIRVLVQVGQRVVQGEPLFQIYAKSGATVRPDSFTATLEWKGETQPQAPWLLGSIGC